MTRPSHAAPSGAHDPVDRDSARAPAILGAPRGRGNGSRRASLEEFLVRWGLAAVFACALVEGDVTLVLAGVVARLGYMSPAAAAAVCAMGLLLNDAVWYGLGRWRADWVRGTKIYLRAEPAVRTVARRLGPWQILLARFVYGTRAASMFFWGVLGLSLPRFVATDLVGCSLWSALLVGTGYILSDSAAALLGDVEKVQTWLLWASLVIMILVLLLRAVLRRRRLRRTPLPTGEA